MGQVGELLGAGEAPVDGEHVGGGVEDLAGRHPRQGTAQDVAGDVTAGLAGGETDGTQAGPDLKNVLDADPVGLEVLAVRDVADIAPEALADAHHRLHLLGGEHPARDPDPHHEVPVLFRALGVQPVPAVADSEVVAGDGHNPRAGVDRNDALVVVEAVLVPLHPLGLVQRLVVAPGPLPLTAPTTGRPPRRSPMSPAGSFGFVGLVASGRSDAGQPGCSRFSLGGVIGGPGGPSCRPVSAGFDTDTDQSVLHLHRVGGDRMGGGPGEDLVASDVEDGAVPRAPQRALADQLSLAQRATGVGTDAVEREELPAGIHQRKPVAVNLDRPHRAGREILDSNPINEGGHRTTGASTSCSASQSVSVRTSGRTCPLMRTSTNPTSSIGN